MPLRSPEHSRGAKGGEYEKMKKILLVSLISVFVALFSLPVFALDQDQEPITVTVTPKLVSISLSDTTVEYGAVSLGTSATSGSITATNDGSVAEDFDIKADVANCAGGSWSLVSGAGDPGQNEFKHSCALGPGFDSFTAMTSAYGDFVNDVSASGTQDFKLQIKMPSSTTVYGQYTTSVEILATEHGS